MKSLLRNAWRVAKGARRALDVQRRQLRTISILATDRCSSRCKHCFIWAKNPNHDLSLEVLEQVLYDDVVGRNTYFELTGGEFMEHPQYRDILALFRRTGHDYMMLSNGMLPDELIETVHTYAVPNLYMSLDGLGETYKKVRGVDWAPNVLRVLDELRGVTNLFVAYTITPWNKASDLAAVKHAVEERGATFFVGAYQNMEFFDTRSEGGKIEPEDEAFVDDFMSLHNSYIDQQVRIPCWNISTKCYLMPNGDVYLCQQKSVVLGNLYEKSLSDIWTSHETLATHAEYRHCNDCWLACNRPFDAELAHAARSALPSAVLNRVLGPHTWDIVHDAYDRS